MTKLRACCIGMSLDGFSAGPDQSLENPLGVGGMAIMNWFFPTRSFQAVHGQGGGETGIDNDFAEQGFANMGAWIIGRNMFGPIRGPWKDDAWKGWWGDNPPYHVPVFVLTNHPRDPIEMQGGTTFHFVTDGIHSALKRANEAAGGKDVRVGGGPATIRQYLEERLLDELHVALGPVLLGRGEPLLAGLDLAALGYSVTSSKASSLATHVVITRSTESKGLSD